MSKCENIMRRPEGLDASCLTCPVCGYYEFVEGRYYRWVGDPQPPTGGPCKRNSDDFMVAI